MTALAEPVDEVLARYDAEIVELWRVAEFEGDRELMARCRRALNGHEASLAGVIRQIQRDPARL